MRPDQDGVADPQGVVRPAAQQRVTMTTTSEPITTGPRSPLSTAQWRTRDPAPIVTSPVTTAVGATQADGWISIRPG